MRRPFVGVLRVVCVMWRMISRRMSSGRERRRGVGVRLGGGGEERLWEKKPIQKTVSQDMTSGMVRREREEKGRDGEGGGDERREGMRGGKKKVCEKSGNW